MSEDEASDYGDYEALGEGVEEDSGLEPAAPKDSAEEAEEADKEAGLDEDAAGTDDEDEEGPEEGTGDEGSDLEPAGATQKAHPHRPKVDPILRASNAHRIVRVVPPDERVTDNRLQTAEASRVISARAEQIAKYATNFARHDPGAVPLHDPVAIAYKELFDRRCPLTLRRPIGTGPAGELVVEDWDVRAMTLPPLSPPPALGKLG
jgi:DNA-directed RNA polymerase subunit K/omega